MTLLTNYLPQINADMSNEYVAPNATGTSELYLVSLDECAAAISLLIITKQDFDHISFEMFKKFSSFFFKYHL